MLPERLNNFLLETANFQILIRAPSIYLPTEHTFHVSQSVKCVLAKIHKSKNKYAEHFRWIAAVIAVIRRYFLHCR